MATPSRIQLAPLGDIHPARALYNIDMKIEENKGSFQRLSGEHIQLSPLHSGGNKSVALPSIIDYEQSNKLKLLLCDGPWAPTKNPYSASLPAVQTGRNTIPSISEKWVFRPLGATIYQGHWERYSDKGRKLLDLRADIIYPGTRVNGRNFTLPMSVIRAGVDPLTGSAVTVNYLQIPKTKADSVSRALRMFSSMPGARQWTFDMTITCEVPVVGDSYRFGFSNDGSDRWDRTFQIVTFEGEGNGKWMFTLLELIPYSVDRKTTAYTSRELAFGLASPHGVELRFNYDPLKKPTGVTGVEDLKILGSELSLVHYAILCSSDIHFIPNPPAQ